MKNSSLKMLGCIVLCAVTAEASAGIYLVYGNTGANPVAVVDEASLDANDEGYLVPRAHAWVAAPRPSVLPPVVPTYPVGGYLPLTPLYMPAPTATKSPQLSRVIQGGHAWSSYQAGNNASGVGLVYSPYYDANASASQRSARGNRARAQAFRLDYYK